MAAIHLPDKAIGIDRNNIFDSKFSQNGECFLTVIDRDRDFSFITDAYQFYPQMDP